MKTTPALLIIGLILAIYACNAQNTGNSTNATVATNDLGCDIRDGKTNKIARIYKVTPTHVQVIYEGGKSGRNIPRQQLPPELAAKYPYDAAKVAEHQRQQAETAASQVAAQQSAARIAAQRRENDIKAEIDKLDEQDGKLQGQINVYANMAGGNGRKRQLAELRNDRQSLRERKLKLQDQLKTLQSRRDATP
jgi:hypothetical protein